MQHDTPGFSQRLVDIFANRFRIMRNIVAVCLVGAVISDHDEANVSIWLVNYDDIYKDAKMDIYEEYMTVKGKI